MAVPNIGGTGSDPTHHIVLFDGVTELGFVVTDQGGDLDERTFRRFPFADPTDPYVTEKQSSFGGGFGQHKFEDDRGKYWISEGVDTTKDRLVLAPQFHHGEGAFEQAAHFLTHSDDVFSWTTLSSVNSWLSTKFTTPAVFGTTTYAKFWVRKTGTPNDMYVRLYSDAAGVPNALLEIATVTPASIDGEHGQWVRILISENLAVSTNYHIVWTSIYLNSVNKWEIGGNGTQITSKKSTSGSSWSNADNDYWFRIEAIQDTFIARFYDYKGQTYFVSEKDGVGTSEVWMNGWRGACDTNVADKSLVKDATNTDWLARITGDEVARIVAGRSSGERSDWRVVDLSAGVLGNGALPVAPDWVITHSTRDDYIVTNTDYFQEIDQNARLTGGHVSDVAVAGGQVFFARNNNRNMVAHREFNKSGTWMSDDVDENWKVTGVYAQFIRPVYDPISGDSLWVGHNNREAGQYRPIVLKSEPMDWHEVGLNFKHLITHTDEGSGAWTSSDQDVAVAENGHGRVQLTVTVNKVLTCSISAPGATYDNGSFEITLVDAGSSGTAKLQVTVTAGAIASIDAYNARGYDYTLGVKTVTGLTGGDGNARIEITALDGFTTGQMAYANLYDVDIVAQDIDARNMTYIVMPLTYETVFVGWNQVFSNGTLTFDLHAGQGATSALVNIAIPGLSTGEGLSIRAMSEVSLDTLEGADSISSVSMTLATTQLKSFTITLLANFFFGKKFAPVEVGLVDGDNITGLQAYGDPETLWVFSEAGLGKVQNNRWMPVPLRELQVARHPNNGVGNEVHDVYLMFTWKGRLQRYFRQNLESLGPEFPAGLRDIAGDVVDVVTYPGRLYVAVDGGLNSSSLILCHKGGAWHEVFTSFTGERIRKLHIQSIPGKSDKLWASVGAGIMWFPITLSSDELPANTDYKFRPTGLLTTSWVYTEDMELNKLWRSVILVRNRANDADLTTTLYYQIDDEDNAWTKITNVDDLNASAKEYHFSDGSAGASVQGGRVRYRIEISTADVSKTPIVRSIQSRVYRLPEIRFAWSWIAKASSISINLRGDEERSLGTQTTVANALAKLDSWAATMAQLSVESNIAAFDARTVLCEPTPYQLLTIVSDEGIEEDVIQVAVNDI